MDRLQQFFVMRAVMDGEWRPDNRAERRVATAAELDAFADFGWHWADVRGVLAMCAHGLRMRWQSASLERVEGTHLATGDT